MQDLYHQQKHTPPDAQRPSAKTSSFGQLLNLVPNRYTIQSGNTARHHMRSVLWGPEVLESPNSSYNPLYGCKETKGQRKQAMVKISYTTPSSFQIRTLYNPFMS